MNLNKLFKRLNIREKLIIAFVALSTSPFLLSGLYGIYSHTRALQEIAFKHLEHDVLALHERTATFLKSVEGDMHFLSHSRLFRQWATINKHRQDGEAIRHMLEEQLLDFVKSKKIYYRIRYLTPRGDEILMVEFRDDDYTIVPQDELDERRAQFFPYYLHLVEGLGPDELVSAPVEFKGKNQSVAAISYAFPLFDDDARSMVGIIVADVFAKAFFHTIDESLSNTGGKVVIASSEGFYLYHPDKKKEWAALLASRDEDNVYQDYPAQVASQILSGTTGTVTEGTGEIISYMPVMYAEAAEGNFYVIFESVPKDIIFASVTSFKWFFFAGSILVLTVSIGLAYVAARQFTQPIGALISGAEIISTGSYSHRLNIQTNDEIERLADQFNRMADSILEREERIKRHETELEEIVKARTKELSEEKSKLQVILDNVPSAFLMLDNDLTIRSASAAFEKITGQKVETVIGRRCNEFGWYATFRLKRTTERALHSRQIALDVTKVLQPDGEETYIEQVAIPIVGERGVDRVLEVITDITQRKRMEQQIIQSERLAVTGEMAAVIAHEARNSLTSVKMILQLHLEGDTLSPADRESLEVASNSIYRMETIVNDLLKFARPASPRFQKGDVNRLIEESISFTQHQIRKKGIELVKEFGLNLPAVMLDPDLLKESFVNLALNAIQAIPDAGRITIKTGTVCASTTRKRALYSEDEKIGETEKSPRKVMAIRRGTPLVRIEIADTGCGIPAHHLHRIFDPFFTTRTDGTGLGLSMAKRIIEQHGGTITVESREGSGSLFTVLLPPADVMG